MKPSLYWINTPTPGRLATMARPRGGDWLADELGALGELDVDLLVSLLTQAEMTELDLAAEAELAHSAGLRFLNFPIPDYTVPELGAATVALIEQLAQAVQSGQTVAVHCRMGIGRSSLIAASVLTMLGLPAQAAFERITAARGRPVPDTDEQRQWVDRFVVARVWMRQQPAEES